MESLNRLAKKAMEARLEGKQPPPRNRMMDDYLRMSSAVIASAELDRKALETLNRKLDDMEHRENKNKNPKSRVFAKRNPRRENSLQGKSQGKIPDVGVSAGINMVGREINNREEAGSGINSGMGVNNSESSSEGGINSSINSGGGVNNSGNGYGGEALLDLPEPIKRGEGTPASLLATDAVDPYKPSHLVEKTLGRAIPPITHPGKLAILRELRKCHGLISHACAEVQIGRSTFYNWLAKDLAFALAYEDVREAVIDTVEGNLLAKIGKGDTIATIFYLKTQAKHRGYVEQNNQVVDAGPGLARIMGARFARVLEDAEVVDLPPDPVG